MRRGLGTSLLAGLAVWTTLVGCAAPPNRGDSAQGTGVGPRLTLAPNGW